MADKQRQDAGDITVTSLDNARKSVDDLYHYRDHYFEKNNISEAIHKNEHVEKVMVDTLRLLQESQDSVPQKAELLMLQGKALNVLPSYNSQAEELLSKAVKLDPHLVEAWIQLGEVYWKNNQVENARNCFQGALQHRTDKTALRNLSMVMRQLELDDKQKEKAIEESVEKARAAVKMDITDGTSWCVLGNAYLYLFFESTQNPKLLKQCMSAYQQADRDPVSRSNPDLHFNRAMVDKYVENYSACLEGFVKAAALDPTWEEPKIKEKQTVAELEKISELVRTKGMVKAKRLTNLISSISDSDLGPYYDGSQKSGNGKRQKLQHVELDDLEPGLNQEKVVVGKVVCSIVSEDPVPFTFCMVDKAGTCFAITVYNIALGCGVKIGDSVAIAAPYQQQVDLTYKDKVFRYKSIRVASPLLLVVNGRKLKINKQAPTKLAIKTVSD